jgi:hypothetical protein
LEVESVAEAVEAKYSVLAMYSTTSKLEGVKVLGCVEALRVPGSHLGREEADEEKPRKRGNWRG